MSPVPIFSSAAEAATAVREGLRFLAAADATQMSVQSQAECLQVLEQSDAIATAARASMLAGEMYERSRPDLPDEDPARGFEDRGVRLETTFQGAGVMSGDLTPECAAIVGAVLDALSAPAGAEDSRTHAQRYHDALAEAMRRLAASDLLPERAGQPVKAWVHISLADLMRLDGSSALLDQWATQVRAQWAAHRAGASE